MGPWKTLNFTKGTLKKSKRALRTSKKDLENIKKHSKNFWHHAHYRTHSAVQFQRSNVACDRTLDNLWLRITQLSSSGCMLTITQLSSSGCIAVWCQSQLGQMLFIIGANIGANIGYKYVLFVSGGQFGLMKIYSFNISMLRSPWQPSLSTVDR